MENPLNEYFNVPYPLDYALCAHRGSSHSPKSLFGGDIQHGSISLLNCSDQKSLSLWEKQIRKGAIKKVEDENLNIFVLEIASYNPINNYITTPIGIHQTLGIRLPILIMVVKNLKKMFLFEIMYLDDKDMKRRLRFNNRQSTSRIKPILSHIPLKMDDGWNVIQVNLQEMANRVYGTNYKEAVRLQIYGNCRITRVLFCDNTTKDQDVLPADVQAFLSTNSKGKATSPIGF